MLDQMDCVFEQWGAFVLVFGWHFFSWRHNTSVFCNDAKETKSKRIMGDTGNVIKFHSQWMMARAKYTHKKVTKKCVCVWAKCAELHLFDSIRLRNQKHKKLTIGRLRQQWEETNDATEIKSVFFSLVFMTLTIVWVVDWLFGKAFAIRLTKSSFKMFNKENAEEYLATFWTTILAKN